jgi:hypothetical protein
MLGAEDVDVVLLHQKCHDGGDEAIAVGQSMRSVAVLDAGMGRLTQLT